MTFGVDPDTHIDTVEQAKASTIEGTSKWSCKLSITGTDAHDTYEILKKKQLDHLSNYLSFSLLRHFLFLISNYLNLSQQIINSS
jgi:hypothetical protein